MTGRTVRRSFLPIFFAAFVAAVDPVGAVEFAPGAEFDLPPPAEFNGRIEALQLVTARHRRDVVTFEGRLSITPDTLLLVATDGTGRRLMTIEWRNGAFKIERAPEVPDDLRPENVVTDIVFMYWPAEAVRRGLTRSHAELIVGDHTRTIALAGREILTIRYDNADPWLGTSRLHNDAWQYDVEVQSQVMSR